MGIFDLDNLERIPRDVSPREYFRGNDGRDFIIMRYPNNSPEHRSELLEFIRIGKWLFDNGIKTPKLYDLDESKCTAKFEDLGRASFGKYLSENPAEQIKLYTLATDILKKLATSGVPNNLPAYSNSKIHKTHSQIIDYYMPIILSSQSIHISLPSSRPTERSGEIIDPSTCARDDNDVLNGYLSAWDEIERSLPPCPQGFIHGDYHFENLMYISSNSGLQQCALIDYQDALHGALPYDLVNLLEDARMDVPLNLRNSMIDHYCNNMSVNEKAVFLQWYRVLGTQFHCRVIGLFIKLAVDQGRDDYLIHINRLQGYIRDALNDPVLSPLKSWFKKEQLDLTMIKDFNGDIIRKFFDK